MSLNLCPDALGRKSSEDCSDLCPRMYCSLKILKAKLPCFVSVGGPVWLPSRLFCGSSSVSSKAQQQTTDHSSRNIFICDLRECHQRRQMKETSLNADINKGLCFVCTLFYRWKDPLIPYILQLSVKCLQSF